MKFYGGTKRDFRRGIVTLIEFCIYVLMMYGLAWVVMLLIGWGCGK